MKSAMTRPSGCASVSALPVCLGLAANCDHCALAVAAASRTVRTNKRCRIRGAYAISSPRRCPFSRTLCPRWRNAISHRRCVSSRGTRNVNWLSRRMREAVSQLNAMRETPMKHRIIQAVAALFLVLVAAPLFAVQRNAVDEVIRMTRAGVAEDTILDYLEKSDARVIVTGDDVIAMTDAHVSKAVIKAVVDAADARRSSNRDYRDRSYVSPRVVVGVGAPYYYDPYYYYDPFWYRPSLSLNLGFGFGRYYGYRGGGHFGGGHFGGGSHGGHRGHR